MRAIDSVSRAEMLETYADLYEAFDDNPYIRKELDKVYDQLNGLQSVEPERKKGKWIDAVLPNDNGCLPVQVCDQCNTFFPLAYTGGGHRFCPNCGADMRGDEHD